MWLIRAALRRPITVLVAVLAIALPRSSPSRGCAPTSSRPRTAGHLRRAAVRRHVPDADGRADRRLLRVPLPLHQRHRAHRVAVDPGHGDAEAHFHPGTDIAQSLAQTIGDVTARARSCRRARCRRSSCASTPARCRSASSSSRARRRSAARSRTSRSTGCARCSRRCRASRAAAVRRQPAHDRRLRRSRSAALLRHLARRGRERDRRGNLHPAGRQRARRRRDAASRDQRDGAQHQGPREAAAPHRRRTDGLPARRRLGRGRRRHLDRHRARQRPPHRLHAGHEAARRLDARRRQRDQGEALPRCRRSCPTTSQVELRVRPVALRHATRSAGSSREGRSARC